MNVVEFIKTIYVGDRGCKSVLIDGWRAEVKIQVTCISRVRSAEWDHSADEDLNDGFLVFEGVRSVTIEPSGVVPNDTINDIRAEPLSCGDAKFLIVIGVDAVDEVGDRTEVQIKIRADAVALESCGDPGRRITH